MGRQGRYYEADIPFLVKGSTTFFLIPFLPFDKRLFCRSNSQYPSSPAMAQMLTFPTAILKERAA